MKSLSVLMILVAAIPASAQDALPNGYADLVTAGKLILPGENGLPSSPETNLSPAENLRRQRLAVARNAPALALVRKALTKPIEASSSLDEKDQQATIKNYAAIRELARQFRQESSVRAADGDWFGSFDSCATAIEMGAAMTRKGPLMNMLVGVAVEAVGRKDLDKVVANLNVEQTRQALERLKVSDERRATFMEIEEVEKRAVIDSALKNFQEPDLEKMKISLTDEKLQKESGLTEAQVKELLVLTPEVLRTQMTKAIDLLVARDNLPFSKARQLKPPASKESIVDNFVAFWATGNSRFNYERNVAAQRLLEDALALRVVKFETGDYPATFGAATDPFGDGTKFVYQRTQGSYRLYSVGPDGNDDGGDEIQTMVISPETGLKIINTRLTPDSTGDILAPVL